MQYPTEVPGVAVDDMLREALAARRGRRRRARRRCWPPRRRASGSRSALLHRALNVDLSGGEKKRNETLQLAVLAPKIAILDELDSGLDIDALRACARRIEAVTQPTDDGPGLGVLAITHYNRLLAELRPDRVHILVRAASSPPAAPSWPTSWRPPATPPSRRRDDAEATGRRRPARRAARARSTSCSPLLTPSEASRPSLRPRRIGRPGRLVSPHGTTRRTSGTARCADTSSSPTSRRRSRS